MPCSLLLLHWSARPCYAMESMVHFCLHVCPFFSLFPWEVVCPVPKVTRNDWLAACSPGHLVLFYAWALKTPDAIWLHCLSVLHFFLSHSYLSPYTLTTLLLLLSTKHISLHSDSYFNTVYLQSWTKHTTIFSWSLDDGSFCWTKINHQRGHIKFRQPFLGTKPWIVSLREKLWPVMGTVSTIVMVVHSYEYVCICNIFMCIMCDQERDQFCSVAIHILLKTFPEYLCSLICCYQCFLQVWSFLPKPIQLGAI